MGAFQAGHVDLTQLFVMERCELRRPLWMLSRGGNMWVSHSCSDGLKACIGWQDSTQVCVVDLPVAPCFEEVAETKHNQAHTTSEAEISGFVVKKLRVCIAGCTPTIVPRAELYLPPLVSFFHAVRLVSPTCTDLHFLV